MAIGVWLLIIGLVIIIAGVVIFYVTSFLSTTWLWVIIGVGVLLIIVGAILFFFVKKKQPPKKVEMLPPPPMYFPPEPIIQPAPQIQPQFIPQSNPLVIPSGGSGNNGAELAIMLQQQGFQQQQQIRELENKFERERQRERDEKRYKQLEYEIRANRVQPPPPMAQYVMPDGRQLIPAEVQRAGQANRAGQGQGNGIRQEFSQAFLNPQVVTAGIQAGAGFAQMAPAILQVATQPQLVELVNKGISKGVPALTRAASSIRIP